MLKQGKEQRTEVFSSRMCITHIRDVQCERAHTCLTKSLPQTASFSQYQPRQDLNDRTRSLKILPLLSDLLSSVNTEMGGRGNTGKLKTRSCPLPLQVPVGVRPKIGRKKRRYKLHVRLKLLDLGGILILETKSQLPTGDCSCNKKHQNYGIFPRYHQKGEATEHVKR